MGTILPAMALPPELAGVVVAADGGTGGRGGTGGYGGAGAGGAGGTVKISGSVVDADAIGVNVDTSGGVGADDPLVKITGNGLRANYWNNLIFSGTPGLVTGIPHIYEGNGSGNSLNVTASDNYYVSYFGSIEVVGDQTVTFHLGSDDGSILRIDGVDRINQFTDHAFQTQSATLMLSSGVHSINVFHYERTGYAGLSLTYSVAGGEQNRLLSIAPEGEGGRFILESNTADGAPTSIAAQSSATFNGPTEINPFALGSPSTPLIADLAGGAEAYGLLDLDVFKRAAGIADTTSDEIAFAALLDNIELQLQGLVDPLKNPDKDALAAVVRLDTGPLGYGDDYANYDMLLFINLSDVALDAPMLGVVDSNTNGYLDGPVDRWVVQRSTVRRFGRRLRCLSGIGAGSIWATLICRYRFRAASTQAISLMLPSVARSWELDGVFAA